MVPERLNEDMKELYLSVIFNKRFDDDLAFRGTFTLEDEFRLCNSMRGKEMNENTKVLDRYYYITQNDPKERVLEDDEKNKVQ
jgi:hypothetical protein